MRAFRGLNALPWAVMTAGALFSLWLASLVPEGGFYVGDGAMRALMARQFTEGRLAPDFQVAAEPWVQELWDEGLYPFNSLLLEIGGRKYLIYPLAFTALTTPFFWAFGFPGLLVVPLAALWLTWACFLLTCRRSGVPPAAAAPALAALVFATPLTLYGAIYWDHTLGVLLSFAGVSAVLAPPASGGSRAWAAGAGALVALGPWVRGELYPLAGFMAALLVLAGWLPEGVRSSLVRHRWVALAGMGTTLAATMGVNLVAVAQLFGLHGITVMLTLTSPYRVAVAREATAQFVPALFRFCPVVVLALAAPLLARRRAGLRGPLAVGALLIVFVTLAVPWVMPGAAGLSWGPRFLFVLAPLACWSAARVLAAPASRVAGAAAWGILLVSSAWGAHLNAYGGTRHLADTYARRARALDRMRADPSPVITTSWDAITKELLPALPARAFFLVRTPKELRVLADRLQDRGVHRFVYLCYRRRPCGALGGPPHLKYDVPLRDSGAVLHLTRVDVWDDYVFYEAVRSRGFRADAERPPAARRPLWKRQAAAAARAAATSQ